MLLNVFFITLTYLSSPINQIDINNENSSYDYTYNELTLYNNLIVRNNVYGTYDVFSDVANVNLDDYLLSDEIGKIDLSVQCGNFWVEDDNFYMYISYEILLYDIDYYLYDSVEVDFEYDEYLAESMMTSYVNVSIGGYFTYTLYDFMENYDKGFADGYDEGNEIGYEYGYDEGYDVGIEEGRNEGQGINNVIDWFGSIWDGLARIFALEIAPNLTIGTIITIPIVIAVLFFGLKALIQ